MWQSRVEKEHYSVAYFNGVTAFVIAKGGTDMHCVVAFTQCVKSPALKNGDIAL